MDSPSNPQGATPSTGGGVVLPANWWQVAANAGYDPAEVEMQIRAYGWKVGTEIIELPARGVKVVDARQEVALGQVLLLVGFLIALAMAFRQSAPNPQP